MNHQAMRFGQPERLVLFPALQLENLHQICRTAIRKRETDEKRR
jgi:hypothetical protein